MPVKPLPPNADLQHLKNQAKDLLKAHLSHDALTAQRLREFHPRFADASDATLFSAALKLSDAQLTVARERGFATWARLKKYLETPAAKIKAKLPLHEQIEEPLFRRGVDLLDAGDTDGLSAHLRTHPNLVHQRVTFEGVNYFRNPALLEFVAENPVRHGKLPGNIAEVARTILDAGARQHIGSLNETLALVCSGCVPRECGVQTALIDLLCEYGADPNSGMPPALPHGEFEAVRALVRHGASLDLTVATTLGDTEAARSLLVSAEAETRHRALALAAQFGRGEIMQMLLDAGEDPDRYNPPGTHSHSTPLHQAALGGHRDVVHLLVERGARLDLQDALFHGTPEGWATHGGHHDIAEYLRDLRLKRA